MEKKRSIFLPLGKGSALKRMSALAFLVAIYILLSFLTFRTGNYSFSIASVVLLVTAILFGPIEGTIVCLLGEFVIQFVNYGGLPPLFLPLRHPFRLARDPDQHLGHIPRRLDHRLSLHLRPRRNDHQGFGLDFDRGRRRFDRQALDQSVKGVIGGLA